MLLGPSSSSSSATGGMPPGFIDFASSSFDAIFYERLPDDNTKPTENAPPSRKRASHLPDLLPFIKLVTEKCKVQPVLLVMALVYVQRFRKALPAGYKAEPQAAHRIFSASLLLASKYSDDEPLSTRRFIRATGDVWSVREMTRMELAFLRFLQWNLHIDMNELETFLRNLDFDVALILPVQRQHLSRAP